MSYLTTHLLPPEQFGGREGYSAPDAVLHLLHKVQTSKEVTSAIMIDVIKGRVTMSTVARLLAF